MQVSATLITLPKEFQYANKCDMNIANTGEPFLLLGFWASIVCETNLAVIPKHAAVELLFYFLLLYVNPSLLPIFEVL